jgi:hypothetical protein
VLWCITQAADLTLVTRFHKFCFMMHMGVTCSHTCDCPAGNLCHVVQLQQPVSGTVTHGVKYLILYL